VNVFLKQVLAGFNVFLAVNLMLGTRPARALEELKVYRGVLVLEGKIVSGDYDKFRSFLGTKSNFDKISSGVFLASPGGNVMEAMRIGRLIRALQLSTDAPSGPPAGIAKFGESPIKVSHLVNPKNYLCASACFFVYVAGIYRSMNWVGRLGVHRPTVERDGRELSGSETSESAWFVRESIKNYLRDMNVPAKYVDLIFSAPANEMRWITQSEFDSDLQGFDPGLRALADKCDPHTSGEKIIIDEAATRSGSLNAPVSEKEKVVSVHSKQSSEKGKCWMRVRSELPVEAWPKVFLGK